MSATVQSPGGNKYTLDKLPDGSWVATTEDGKKHYFQGYDDIRQTADDFSAWLDPRVKKDPYRDPISDIGGVIKDAPLNMATEALGVFGNVEGWGRDRVNDVSRMVGGPPNADQAITNPLPVPPQNKGKFFPSSQDLREDISRHTGYEFSPPPQSPGGKILDAGVKAAGGAGPFGMTSRAAATFGPVRNTIRAGVEEGFIPGVASAGAAEFFQNTPFQVPGAALAGMASSRWGRNVVTPNPMRPELRPDQIQTLQQHGVTSLTAGQRTGNFALLNREAETGGGAFQRVIDEQNRQFTGALARLAGFQGVTHLSQPIVDGMFRHVGRVFDHMQNYDVTLNTTDRNNIQRALGNYLNNTQAPVPIVQQRLGNIITDFDRQFSASGRLYRMSGTEYANLRSELGKLAAGHLRGKNSHPDVADALFELQHVLDDAMERAIALSGNFDDLGALQQARQSYRSLKILERAYTATDEMTRGGFIQPTALQQAVKAVEGTNAYARGLSEFGVLADAAGAVMKLPSSSNTAIKSRVANISSRIGGAAPALIGASGGAMAGGDVASAGMGALVGAGAGVLVPPVVGRGLMSWPVQGYLGNQVLSRLPDRGWADRFANMGAIGQGLDPWLSEQ